MHHPQTLLDELASFDTPTICNALEVLDDGFCDYGYTKEPLMCAFPDHGPNGRLCRDRDGRDQPANRVRRRAQRPPRGLLRGGRSRGWTQDR